jgi:hypothetical protein
MAEVPVLEAIVTGVTTIGGPLIREIFTYFGYNHTKKEIKNEETTHNTREATNYAKSKLSEIKNNQRPFKSSYDKGRKRAYVEYIGFEE